METRVGLLTPDQEVFLASVLDKYFTFSNRILEMFDKTIFKILVRTLDNDELDKISSDLKSDLIPIVDAAIAKDIDTVTNLSITLLEKRAAIPGLNTEVEALVYDSLVKLIVSIILWFLNKKKDESN